MSPMEVKELERQACEEYQRGGGVKIELTWLEASIVIGQMQLALRHPHNTGAATIIARQIVASLTCRLPRALRTIAKLGNDPRYDQPTGAPTDN